MRLVKLLSRGEGIRTLLWTFIKSFQVTASPPPPCKAARETTSAEAPPAGPDQERNSSSSTVSRAQGWLSLSSKWLCECVIAPGFPCLEGRGNGSKPEIPKARAQHIPQTLLERGDCKASSEECFVREKLVRSEAVRARGLLGEDCASRIPQKPASAPHIHSDCQRP